MLNLLHVVKEHDRACTAHRRRMWRAQTEPHQCAFILPIARPLEDVDQALDPFVILRRSQIDQIAQGRRRMHKRRIVAAMRDELR